MTPVQADVTVQTHFLYLKKELHNQLTLELTASWKITFPYRRKQLIDQPGTVCDYLNEYKFLQIEEIGKTLVSFFFFFF